MHEVTALSTPVYLEDVIAAGLVVLVGPPGRYGEIQWMGMTAVPPRGSAQVATARAAAMAWVRQLLSPGAADGTPRTTPRAATLHCLTTPEERARHHALGYQQLTLVGSGKMPFASLTPDPALALKWACADGHEGMAAALRDALDGVGVQRVTVAPRTSASEPRQLTVSMTNRDWSMQGWDVMAFLAAASVPARRQCAAVILERCGGMAGTPGAALVEDALTVVRRALVVAEQGAPGILADLLVEQPTDGLLHQALSDAAHPALTSGARR